MGHTWISGNEPSSAILFQIKYNRNLIRVAKNLVENGVMNPQNYTFNKVLKPGNFDALKRYESTEVDRRTWLQSPLGYLVHQQ